MTAPRTYASFAAIAEGDAVPPITLAFDFTKVAMVPFGTWDFFAGHHDPAAARAQGQKDIFLNTGAFQGIADRIVTDWTGPATFIARRKMQIVGSVYPGDTLTGGGTVTRKYSENGQDKIDVALEMITDNGGRVCIVETTAVLKTVEA